MDLWRTEYLKTFGLSDKGKKADIKEAKSIAKETAPVLEAVQEDEPLEDGTLKDLKE